MSSSIVYVPRGGDSRSHSLGIVAAQCGAASLWKVSEEPIRDIVRKAGPSRALRKIANINLLYFFLVFATSLIYHIPPRTYFSLSTFGAKSYAVCRLAQVRCQT